MRSELFSSPHRFDLTQIVSLPQLSQLNKKPPGKAGWFTPGKNVLPPLEVEQSPFLLSEGGECVQQNLLSGLQLQ